MHMFRVAVRALQPGVSLFRQDTPPEVWASDFQTPVETEVPPFPDRRCPELQRLATCRTRGRSLSHRFNFRKFGTFFIKGENLQFEVLAVVVRRFLCNIAASLCHLSQLRDAEPLGLNACAAFDLQGR